MKKQTHTMSIVLSRETHQRLKALAEQELRPVAQMARVIIEKAVRRAQ